MFATSPGPDFVVDVHGDRVLLTSVDPFELGRQVGDFVEDGQEGKLQLFRFEVAQFVECLADGGLLLAEEPVVEVAVGGPALAASEHASIVVNECREVEATRDIFDVFDDFGG